MSVYLRTENGVLYHGDCMEHFGKILKGSVDMVLCDLPYGITNCDWDKKIALAPLWRAWNVCLKDEGVVCLTAQQPFVTELITSCLRPMKFRYELIWEKSKACGFLNANRMPLRAHENILIFYKKLPYYNPQMTTGKPYITKRGKSKASSVYHFNGKSIDKTNEGTRYPRSVLRFAQEARTKHPTEKPQALFEWLIRTYTRPGETVLDNCIGSGTTAAACEALGRKWIGIEKETAWCEAAKERLCAQGVVIQIAPASLGSTPPHIAPVQAE